MLHGREVEEERKKDRIRHMLTAPIRVNNNSVVAAPDFVSSPSPSSLSSPADSFYKVLLFSWAFFFLLFFGFLSRSWSLCYTASNDE
jgi:hypothetical protein